MKETEKKCVSFEIYNEPLLGIKEIAKLANIDENIQKNNILKTAKRGRKPKKMFKSFD